MARSIKNVKNVIDKYNTIIFDFDGTLINSEPAHNEGHRIMLETLLGHKIPDFDSFVDSYIGKKDSIIFEEFKEYFNLSCDTATMFELKRNAVLDILLNDNDCMLKYIEDSKAENVTNEDIFKIHEFVEKAKHRKEVGIQYMRLWEENERMRKEALAEGKAEGKAGGVSW